MYDQLNVISALCVARHFSNFFLLSFAEAHRALELLEDYHAKLTRPQDKQLRLAIERVIRIFKSRLFQALLGESDTNCKSQNFYNIFRNSPKQVKRSYQKLFGFI